MIWHKFDPEDKETWPPVSTDILVIRKVMGGRVIRRGYHSAINHKYFCVEGILVDVKTITHWTPMPELPVEGYEHKADFIRQIKESAKRLDAECKGRKYDLYCTADIYSLIAALTSEREFPANIVDIYAFPPAMVIPSGTAMLCAHGEGPAYAVHNRVERR